MSSTGQAHISLSAQYGSSGRHWPGFWQAQDLFWKDAEAKSQLNLIPGCAVQASAPAAGFVLLLYLNFTSCCSVMQSVLLLLRAELGTVLPLSGMALPHTHVSTKSRGLPYPTEVLGGSFCLYTNDRKMQT